MGGGLGHGGRGTGLCGFLGGVGCGDDMVFSGGQKIGILFPFSSLLVAGKMRVCRRVASLEREAAQGRSCLKVRLMVGQSQWRRQRHNRLGKKNSAGTGVHAQGSAVGLGSGREGTNGRKQSERNNGEHLRFSICRLSSHSITLLARRLSRKFKAPSESHSSVPDRQNRLHFHRDRHILPRCCETQKPLRDGKHGIGDYRRSQSHMEFRFHKIHFTS